MFMTLQDLSKIFKSHLAQNQEGLLKVTFQSLLQYLNASLSKF